MFEKLELSCAIVFVSLEIPSSVFGILKLKDRQGEMTEY